MKRLSYILLSALLLVQSSCVSYFLQKPQSDDVTAAEVFSSRENAMTAIAQAYTDGLRINIVLGQDTPNTYGMEYASIANISGELMGYRYNWMDPVMISMNGMSPTDNNRMIDNYNYNFTAIRRCYTVRDNIDLVPDMSDQEKSYVKAEMMALVAYRYCRMLIQYGGVPIIEGVIDFSQRGMVRRPVKDVLQFIVKICDETAPALPDKWDNANIGRMTKGAALSIKAQALLYCARPLFNTNVPYMQMPNGDNSLICMNEPANEQLWEQARDAAQDVIDWANNESGWCKIINTGDPLNDYGRACAAPDSEEVILALNHVENTEYDPREESGAANNMTYEQLRQYYTATGEDQTWPMYPETGTREEYMEKVNEMEPRYWASATPGGFDCKTNTGYDWTAGPLSAASSWEGKTNIEHCGRHTKMWYHAEDRTWFNFPIYRLAYFYLAVAEAENELGHTSEALAAIKPIRERAGLPQLTASDQKSLRKAIQREWAIEFFEENDRLFAVKHWKLEDLGNGIIGGEKLAFWFEYGDQQTSWTVNNYESYTVRSHYTAFWGDNQYLNPIPQSEVNKGEIVQNPGY